MGIKQKFKMLKLKLKINVLCFYRRFENGPKAESEIPQPNIVNKFTKKKKQESPKS